MDFSKDSGSRLYLSDSLEELKKIPSNSVDLVCTDPPYGIGFLGMPWDKPPTVEMFKEILRVMKPGALAFVFASYREDVQNNFYNLMVQSGFKMSFTSLIWVNGSGFPKAHRIRGLSKKYGRKSKGLENAHVGLPLKTVCEKILVGMKPLEKKSYSAQALANGKGISWLDDCRIPRRDKDKPLTILEKLRRGPEQKGRFPPNLLISDATLADMGFDILEYLSLDAWWQVAKPKDFIEIENILPLIVVPRASRKEKEAGLDQLKARRSKKGCKKEGDGFYQKQVLRRVNPHPCVKPVKLMGYLIVMGSREGELVLDPFAGVGSTLMAAKAFNRKYLGIEICPQYFEIALARLKNGFSFNS